MAEDTGINALLAAMVAAGEALAACGLGLRISGVKFEGVLGAATAMWDASTLTWIVAGIVFLLEVAGTITLLLWLRRMFSTKTERQSADQFKDMRRKAAIAKAKRILASSMPSAPDTEADKPTNLVRFVGQLRSKPLWMQYEDPESTYAVTRSGKTRLIVARRVIEAPGPVLATSTKVDGIALTWLARRNHCGGQTLTLDPMGLACGPEQIRWNPVLGCEDFNVARERGTAFTAGSSRNQDHGNNKWFVDRGAQILGYFFHAAALADLDIDAVHRWVSRPEEAIDILASAGTRTASMMVSTLRDLMVDMAPETSSGFKGTMQGALEPLMIDSVFKVLTPPKVASFDAMSFLRSKDALWVLSPEKDGAVASVTTMFVDHVLGTARRLSNTLPGQRLTPPLSNILDEAANVAPLPNLDGLYSEGPGRGIFTSAFFQDESQVVARWGKDVAKVIFQQSRGVYVLGGSKDADWNQRIANLTQQFEKRRTTYSDGPSGPSMSTHTQRESVMKADQVGKIPFGKALLACAGHDAVIVDLGDISSDKRWGKDVQRGQQLYNEHLLGRSPAMHEGSAWMKEYNDEDAGG